MEQHLAAIGVNSDDTGARRSHGRGRRVPTATGAGPPRPHVRGRRADRLVALEVMTRRYYRMRALGDLESRGRPRPPMLQAPTTTTDGIRVHVLTTTGPIDELGDMVADAATVGVGHGGRPRRSWSTSTPGLRGRSTMPTSWPNDPRRVLDASLLPSNVRRVVVVVGRVGSERMSSLRHHTFRWSSEGFHEDDFLRGLHPLMAARLRLSQLRNFTIERLPAGDDVYVFHARARDNPDDERLFALAEVRDLTAVHDDTGRVVALPQLERVAPRGARRHSAVPGPTAARAASPVEPRAAARVATVPARPRRHPDRRPPARSGDRGARPRAHRGALPPP